MYSPLILLACHAWEGPLSISICGYLLAVGLEFLFNVTHECQADERQLPCVWQEDTASVAPNGWEMR